MLPTALSKKVDNVFVTAMTWLRGKSAYRLNQKKTSFVAEECWRGEQAGEERFQHVLYSLLLVMLSANVKSLTLK